MLLLRSMDLSKAKLSFLEEALFLLFQGLSILWLAMHIMWMSLTSNGVKKSVRKMPQNV